MSARDLITFGLGPAAFAFPTAAEIADAVLDEALGTHAGFLTTLATSAELATDAELATAVRTELATELAEISAIEDTVNHITYGNSALADAVAAIPTAAAPSAADNADAVADELLAGHLTPGSLGVVITDILADTGEIGTAGAGLTAIPKTGYKLAADGLDSISTTAPSGVASNFREMIVAVWRRFYKKATMTATQLKTYDDAGTGVLTTQTTADDGTTQTQGAAT